MELLDFRFRVQLLLAQLAALLFELDLAQIEHLQTWFELLSEDPEKLILLRMQIGLWFVQL